jgi:hypothetical protein
MIGKWHLVSEPTGFDHWDILYYPVDEWELFDLGKDPQEMRSVYADLDFPAAAAGAGIEAACGVQSGLAIARRRPRHDIGRRTPIHRCLKRVSAFRTFSEALAPWVCARASLRMAFARELPD